MNVSPEGLPYGYVLHRGTHLGQGPGNDMYQLIYSFMH